jgi:hypothetical protein
MRIPTLLVVIVLAQPFLSGVTGAEHTWTLLGSRAVSQAAGNDTLAVTGARVVDKLQLRVKGTPVSFQRIVVRYAHGEDERIELSRDAIPAGGESRAIDLPDSSDRVIRSVQLWYDAESLQGGPAVVEVYGRR